MPLYLGIDGGGTKTECVVGDESSILGRFTAGTSKIQRVGRDAATNSLRAAIQGALYAAGRSRDEVVHSCAGFAGASQTEVRQWLAETMAEFVPGGLTVVGDHIIAHEAAFEGGPGVLVIAGTGSIAYGRNEHDQSARAGGWGPVISDEGSGEWIGRAATGACLRAFDAGTATSIMVRVLNTWRVSTREDIIRLVNSYPTPNFAGLFPQVLAAADEGDALAREILTRAGHELAQLALIVIRKLWPTDVSVTIAASGGVVTNASLVRQAMQDAIRAERKRAAFDDSSIDPTQGALYLARHAPPDARP